MNLFITGIGSGLGEALAREYLERGRKVYAVSRFLPRDLEGAKNLHFVSLNLHAKEQIIPTLKQLLDETQIDVAILNAGKIGELKDMNETSLFEIEAIMDLNVWANKVILDYFVANPPKQIVAISSGASVSGARGWNGYALSKATLNMLIKLYAKEMPHTHLSSVAPGLIDTPMMEHILKFTDRKKFPVVERLASSKRMSPQEAAKRLIDAMDRLRGVESGSYIDIRDL